MTREKAYQKAFSKVEKLNIFIADSIRKCGGEHDLYLDNSSTIQGAPEHVEPNYNIKEDNHLYAGDEELCRAIYLEEEDGQWYEDIEFPDMLKWQKACVRRGVKYFKEYNPDLDDNDEAREEFLNNL